MLNHLQFQYQTFVNSDIFKEYVKKIQNVNQVLSTERNLFLFEYSTVLKWAYSNPQCFFMYPTQPSLFPSSLCHVPRAICV